MGLVAYLVDNLPDLLPHLGSDVGVVIDDPGDCGARDAGQLGYFFERRRHRLLLEALPEKAEVHAREGI
jgi:hypothetical protein